MSSKREYWIGKTKVVETVGDMGMRCTIYEDEDGKIIVYDFKEFSLKYSISLFSTKELPGAIICKVTDDSGQIIQAHQCNYFFQFISLSNIDEYDQEFAKKWVSESSLKK